MKLILQLLYPALLPSTRRPAPQNAMALLWITVLTAFGQPSFEVAVVKPTPPETRILGDLVSYPGGRVRALRCTLDLLLQTALRVESFQLLNKPRWVDQEQFDIDARPPTDSQASKRTGNRVPLDDEQRQMLLALLIERFNLAFHREMQQAPVFYLVKSGKALKLSPAKDPTTRPWAGSPNNGVIRGDGIKGVNISMPELASRLSQYMERPVIDKSGLEGSFDFLVDYKIDIQLRDRDIAAITAVQALGLKFESGRAPIEMIVFDRISRLTN